MWRGAKQRGGAKGWSGRTLNGVGLRQVFSKEGSSFYKQFVYRLLLVNDQICLKNRASAALLTAAKRKQ